MPNPHRPENTQLISILGVAYAHLLAYNNKVGAAAEFVPAGFGYPPNWVPGDIAIQPLGENCTYLACARSEICPGCNQRQAHQDTLVVAIDGVCSDNSKNGGTMKSGIGVYVGKDSQHNFKARLPDLLHGNPMTSQNAELLAAAKALLHIFWLNKLDMLRAADKRLIVIKTTSRYVVDGMTKWVPKWKQAWWNANRAGPAGANVELFRKVGAAVRMLEKRLNCKVLFWYVGKEHNLEAAALAKEGLEEELRDWS